jgi:hypothetical protein
VVYLHVGPPKTGTTYLQDVVWRNRAVLAERGMFVPGTKPGDHFQAGFALRGLPTVGDAQDSDGRDAWDRLVQQIASAEGSQASLISDERLAACTEDEIARAVASLRTAEVRVIYGLRAPVEILMSEWQQTVKGGNQQTFAEFLAMVRTRRTPSPVWYWQVHDVPEVIRRWTSVIGSDQFFLLTLPPPGSDKRLLWRRFASVLGVDGDGFDLDVRRNPSLGREGVELMRQLNDRMPPDYPRRFRLSINRDTLGDRILAARADDEKIRPPQQAIEWAEQYTQELTETLTTSPCPLIGDVTDLRRDDLAPGAMPVAASLDIPDVALDAVVGLLQECAARTDRARQDRAKIVTERNAARQARDTLRQERDRLRRELDRLRNDHSALRRRSADLERQLITAQQATAGWRMRRRVVEMADRHRLVGHLLTIWRWGRPRVRSALGPLRLVHSGIGPGRPSHGEITGAADVPD